MTDLRIGVAAAEIIGDDSMVIAGGIHPYFVSGQEGKLRASAVVVEGDTKICIVSCDVLMMERDILDQVCRDIEADYGIPFENILITATHTHHAPSTVTIHGYSRDEIFCQRVKDAIVSAVRSADQELKDAPNVEMYFGLGQEATVGQNSRLLLKDGTIYWVGPRDDAVRPTGPFDPELPVIAFKKADGSLEALLFNHSTHNIGARENKRSPGFYGLAAQELEEELGGTVIFLPGAAGSTHSLGVLHKDGWTRKEDTNEKILRIKAAIKQALSFSERREVASLRSLKKEIEYRVREFDEEKEDAAVSYYCNKRVDNPQPTIEVFRSMRKELARHQGEVRKTWLQAMLLGDIALVGVPGEFFTLLGLEVKRRSPFRYTYVVELANDYIGYIPDKEAYDLGGYQVWTGFHSFVARGTGERMVEEALQLLSSLHDSAQGDG